MRARTSRDVELLGLFHARKLRVHELALRRRAGTTCTRARAHRRFYDRFTPAISERDFALRPERDGATSTRALDFVAVCRP